MMGMGGMGMMGNRSDVGPRTFSLPWSAQAGSESERICVLAPRSSACRQA